MDKKKQNLLRGITLRKNVSGATINVNFTYRGVRCREPLSNLPVTPNNIRYAERLLGEIKNNIERNIFDYAKQFPNSSKLKLFGVGGSSRKIIDYLNEYLAICKKRDLSPSTIVGYKKCRTALAKLHEFPAGELTPAIIKKWIQDKSTSTKTIRNQLSYLRSALDEAVTDGIININPVAQVSVARYKSVKKANDDYEVDPFNPEEIEIILAKCRYEQWANLFIFAFETGLRSSELCAIYWNHIDFNNKTAHICQAKVVKIIKGTKTEAGTRIVELTDRAIQALHAQKQHTFMFSNYVFHDPKTNQAWDGADAIRKKAWVPTLKLTNIRYRNPYQARHTFATRHISQGVNLFWLASQMGHKGPEMLFRRYGKYLKEYDGNVSKIPDVNSTSK